LALGPAALEARPTQFPLALETDGAHTRIFDVWGLAFVQNETSVCAVRAEMWEVSLGATPPWRLPHDTAFVVGVKLCAQLRKHALRWRGNMGQKQERPKLACFD
jgi:hypothetical protein